MFYFCFGEDIFVAKKTATKARLVFGGQLVTSMQSNARSKENELRDQILFQRRK